MKTAADTAAILRARARALARASDADQVEAEGLEVVEFGLAHERYAVEAVHVREVHPLHDLAPLPCTPPFVRGLVNIRGQLLAVIDLKRFFELPEPGITDLHSVLLIDAGGMQFGLLADFIVGTRTVPPAGLQAALPTLTEIRADYLKGITPERLVILDAARLAADPRILVHEEVPE